MFLEEFHATHFRNLNDVRIKLSSDLNIVTGDNAAGKSSLLEAISYLVSGRSFRTSKQNLLVKHHSRDFTLYGKFSDSTKLGVNYLVEDKVKRIKLNGEESRSLSKVASFYPVQVLSPESYHLVDSGPLERRKYLDWVLFHVEQCYQDSWGHFNKLLKQRNAFFRLNPDGRFSSELITWNLQYVKAAEEVDKLRRAMGDALLPVVKSILSDINFEHVEDLAISYYSGYTGSLAEKLEESVEKDFVSCNTQYGPHKADLRLKIGKYLAKDVLSRGQKKLLVNSLYLAQTEILKKRTQKDSLFVVDDFSSELDETNQSVLVEALRKQENVQIFLSCLQANMLKSLIKGYNNVKMFHVEHGEIKEVKV